MRSSTEAIRGTKPRPLSPAGTVFLSLALMVIGPGLAPGSASAQAVRGEIRDAETKQPVQSARLVVRGQDDSVVSELAVQPSGQFTLLGLPEGPLVLEVSAEGYAASAETTIDHQGTSIFVAIELDLDPVAAEGIRVTVQRQDPYLADRGYYLRQRVGHGHFLDPSEMSLLQPSDMFRRVAGMRVVYDEPVIGRGPSSFRRCRPAVYQDGMLVRSELSDMAFNDVVAPAAWIQAVEVYTGPAAAPAQWRGSASCGLIVVWTTL